MTSCHLAVQDAGEGAFIPGGTLQLLPFGAETGLDITKAMIESAEELTVALAQEFANVRVVEVLGITDQKAALRGFRRLQMRDNRGEHDGILCRYVKKNLYSASPGKHFRVRRNCLRLL
ncbi:hypothetical protein SBA3_1780015 [Candidatus Sulfopaludibacter sp. SbA3]|nr:hypothetical protein SBA3_1780015 [Candidatus Sulfopaludibacter sp. SbA3]